jgi:hypothetical protein
MNDRNLAIQVSKHPLIRKLLETKMATTSVVARLIVEEMMIDEMAAAKPKDNIATKVRNHVNGLLNANKTLEEINASIEKLTPQWTEYAKNKAGDNEETQRIFLDWLEKSISKHLERAAKQIDLNQKEADNKNPFAIEDAKKELEAANKETESQDAEIEKAEQQISQSQEDSEEKINLPDIPIENKKKYVTTSLYKALEGNRVAQMAILSFLHFFENASVQEATLRDLEEPVRQRIGKAVSELKKVSTEMAQQFVEVLKEKPELVAQAIQQISVKEPEDEDEDLAAAALGRAEELEKENPTAAPEQVAQKAVEDTAPPKATEEQKEEAKKEVVQNLESETPEEKVEDFQVSETTLAALKGSVEEFITEFYEVPFLTDQAKLVKAIMNALAEVKKELEKEPEQQASIKGKRKVKTNEQEEPAPASEDLLKNIRVDLRAFLKLTKKTKAALKTFKSNAEKGSFMTDSSKEEFMKLIARLQMTIAEIVGELKKMSPMNEQEEPQEEKEDWEKAQDFYNEAADALDGLVKTLDDGGPANSPIELIDTASKNLFSLTQFFPSVNPFSAGKKDLGDITEYDAEFDEAVKEVKSHVQSILALVKEKVGGKSTIRETIVGLEEFSGKIQNIFGAESNLEGVKVSPEDDALEGETTNDQADTEINPGDDTQAPSDDDLTKPSQDKDFFQATLGDRSPINYFNKMYDGPVEFGKGEKKRNIVPILEKVFTYFAEEVKKLNLSENLVSVKGNLKKLDGATKALDLALDRLDDEKQEDFQDFLDFIGSRKAGEIGKDKQGTGQNKAIKPFTKTIVAIYNAKGEIKKGVDLMGAPDLTADDESSLDPTEVIPTEVISDEAQETIADTVKQNINKINKEQPTASEEEKIEQAETETMESPEVQAILDEEGIEKEDVEKEVERVVSKKADPNKNSIADYEKLKAESERLRKEINNNEVKYRKSEKTKEDYKFHITDRVEVFKKEKEKIDKQIEKLANEMGMKPKPTSKQQKAEFKIKLGNAKSDLESSERRLEKAKRTYATQGGEENKEDVERLEKRVKDAKEEIEKLEKQKGKFGIKEQIIANKLKPLIKEMLKKGR